MAGARIKSARRLRNMTLKELATRSGISEGHMSKIENEKVEASLALLHRVAQALGMTLDLFFEEPDAAERSVSRAGERPVLKIDAVRNGNGLRLERVIPCTPDHMLQCNIHIVEPGGSSDGQIDHVGLSNFAAWQVMKAACIAARFDLTISILQPMYSLIKRQAEVEILPIAASEGMVVAGYSPLAGGLLTGKYARGETGRLTGNERYAVRYGPVSYTHLTLPTTPYV